ncbi:Peroxidase [Actinidia chinensis var. chinensis]|uniref:Peroxidase n=1 Tax=Actinidia chinensis var. chinensis TaxID=1590841 RepID=A0A2R6PT02_ACTCC|nr:Peroxidase [Actinidia chinensis var. chinensis]
MDFMRILIFSVFVMCVLISLKKENAETKKNLPTIIWSPSNSASISTAPWISRPMFLSNTVKKSQEVGDSSSLEYDFYRESCPDAEKIIRSRVRRLYNVRSNIAPALLRLLFHDCFIEGCDASVLLDAIDGIDSEKEAPPNETLKGFDLIDIIKSDLEEACPGIVSCADVLVLAARESVALAGGPFYPLQTGRRDSTLSFGETAAFELPSPQDDLPKTIASFGSRGFDERETVSLLGAHSIGTINCKFILSRLYNFDGTDKPDPTLDTEFLNLLRSRCNNNHTSPSLSPSSADGSPPPSSVEDSLPSSSIQEPKVEMDYKGRGSGGFGMLYYRRLLQAKGILYVDQQLTAGEETETWVRAYASDVSLFRRDFALAMMKLSNLGVLTAPTGQVRITCSKVA